MLYLYKQIRKSDITIGLFVNNGEVDLHFFVSFVSDQMMIR